MKQTQRQRIVFVLTAVKEGKHHRIPFEYLRKIDGEMWLSARYIKQVMLISECNGRISELRSDGYDIASQDKDEYGFVYHRLVDEPARPKRIVSWKKGERDGIAVMIPIYG